MILFTSALKGIPSIFPRKSHPKPPLDNPGAQAVQTNKFYANLLLDNRTAIVYPFPYSIWYADDYETRGLAISHVVASQRVFGPDPSAQTAQYYFNPTNIKSVCLSGEQFTHGTSVSTYAWGPLSVVVRLKAGNGTALFPIVSGLGFVTGVYSGVRPLIYSGIGIKCVSPFVILRRGVSKLRITLENSVTWVVYASSPSGSTPGFTTNDQSRVYVDSTEANLTVQVAVLYDPAQEPVFDSAAGAYASRVQLDGGTTQDGLVGVYSLNYILSGSSAARGTLVYAAPHHVEAFTSSMNGKVTNFYIDSTTLGKLRLCVTDKLEMFERLPRDVGFLPWTQDMPVGDSNFDLNKYTGADLDILAKSALADISYKSIPEATNLDSMYFSGKAFAKYAMILVATHFILRDQGMTANLLDQLKTAFARFVRNEQRSPLFYDSSWKGICSQAGINDPLADFGNTYYNDHHFHYGYFVYTAAVIGKVDQDLGGNWRNDKDTRDWVNTLVRDIADFSGNNEFPICRMFDWYQGHSLAKGIFSSNDGKDEESSSEDYTCFYGLKLWGIITGDLGLEERSNLILAIQRRAMNKYMLFSNDNREQPAQIIPNKVSGIKFDNKIDHTTYFGTNPEYIHGIHMLPITPISSFVRGSQFVREEWEQKIKGFVDYVESGWRGILKLNQALIDPKASYDFFATDNFDYRYIDDGLSRTWALAFAKGVQ